MIKELKLEFWDTELKPEQIRAIEKFIYDMVNKLEENSHKGGWEKCDMTYLYHRAAQEIEELKEALFNRKRVVSECADVANFAMMIADNIRREEGYYEEGD